MSVLQSCSSYRESNIGSKERQGPTLGVRLIESNKGSKERQGPTLGVRLIESQIKGVKKGRDQL